MGVKSLIYSDKHIKITCQLKQSISPKVSTSEVLWGADFLWGFFNLFFLTFKNATLRICFKKKKRFCILILFPVANLVWPKLEFYSLYYSDISRVIVCLMQCRCIFIGVVKLYIPLRQENYIQTVKWHNHIYEKRSVVNH